MRLRSHWGANSLLLCVLGILANSASAQGSVRVAVCPWESGVSAQRLAEDARRVGQRVAEELLDAAPARDLASAMKNGGCTNSVEDLAPLAIRASAAYALHARLEAPRGTLQLHWRLVSREGRLVASSGAGQPFELRGAEAEGPGAVERLAARFYAEQVQPRLAPLPLASSSAEPESAAVGSAPLASPIQGGAKVEPFPWRWVGVGSAVAGAVGLGVSAALVMSAQGDRELLTTLLDEQGNRPPSARHLSESLTDRGRWATGTLIAGGVLLGAGALMVIKGSTPEVVPSASVSADGAALILTGRF